MSKVLSNVKSPFTNEKIKDLIRCYLEVGRRGTYKSLTKTTDYRNEDTRENNERLNRGKNEVVENVRGIIGDRSFTREQGIFQRFVINENMDEKHKIKNMRIYLNLPPEKRNKFVNDYVNSCIVNGSNTDFKYTNDYSRKDNMVIYLNDSDLDKQVKILEELGNECQFLDPPPLAGRYNNIGIASESVLGGDSSFNADRVLTASKTIISLLQNNPEIEENFYRAERENAKALKRKMRLNLFRLKKVTEEEKSKYRGIKEYRNIDDYIENGLKEKLNYIKERFNNKKEIDDYMEDPSKVVKDEEQIANELDSLGNSLYPYLQKEIESGRIPEEMLANEYRDNLEKDGISRDGVFTKDIEEKIMEENEYIR